MYWVLLELAANTRVVGMNVAWVRHKARRQRDNSTAAFSADQRAIRLDVFSRVSMVSVAVNVFADVSDPVSKVPIEIEEGDFETLRETSTDRAFASSTWANQSDLRRAAHVPSK